ncbi:hypothetical membrane protein [Syntrophus aciditrophicus SB]|uniref:Hypothetical membrane protein n=1 Tax=Syntrophus aciditrophicus (strain SB) TaxID=56780 RepID=Q2LT61_SYNAS|nr:hypothetical membrane protein [Syntrophus aciditrophicus SB]
MKTRSFRRFDEINSDRFGFFQEFLINDEGNTLFRYNQIISLWLIQNHGEIRCVALRLQKNSDFATLLIVFQKLFYFFNSLFCGFYHDFILLDYVHLRSRTLS